MTDRALPVTAILAAGIGMGFAGDELLRASAGPGLNVFLLFVGLAVSVWIVAQSGESPLSREASSWIGVGLLCGAALLWRGSGLLRFGTFVAACTAFALPALNAGRAWIKRSGILDVFESVAGAGLHSAFGSARLINRENWGEVGTDTSRGAARTVVRTAFGGALLALVPLVVFGALFISADEVFATIIGDFVRIDLQAFASHLVVIAVLSWLACGYLVGVSSGTRLEGIRRLQPTRPSLGIAEVATALGLVDLLFLGFVIVQFRYLFGGGAWVEVTPGLTYAAYARAGFFQLVAAVALAIPWLLATHALLGDRSLKARFEGTLGVRRIRGRPPPSPLGHCGLCDPTYAGLPNRLRPHGAACRGDRGARVVDGGRGLVRGDCVQRPSRPLRVWRPRHGVRPGGCAAAHQSCRFGRPS